MIGVITVSMNRVQTLTNMVIQSKEEISKGIAALKIVLVVVDSDGVRSGGDEAIRDSGRRACDWPLFPRENILSANSRVSYIMQNSNTITSTYYIDSLGLTCHVLRTTVHSSNMQVRLGPSI